MKMGLIKSSVIREDNCLISSTYRLSLTADPEIDIKGIEKYERYMKKRYERNHQALYSSPYGMQWMGHTVDEQITSQ